MSSIGGQRSRIARANFNPSIEPGMSMSVKTMRMSFRDFQDSDGFISVGCFDRCVSCCLHQIHRMKATKNLVLND